MPYYEEISVIWRTRYCLLQRDVKVFWQENGLSPTRGLGSCRKGDK